jgi:mono/diheme cytochrome c family protein
MDIKFLYFSIIYLVISGCASSDNNSGNLSGKELFENNCAQCHGNDGRLCNSGATDLSLSNLSDEECKDRIKNGINTMPPMGEVLGSEKNVEAVVQYIKTLRKK